MSNYDDDEREAVEVWVAPHPTRNVEETEAAAEEIQRRICRDRMLAMWRGAVGAVGAVVKAAHEREAEDQPKPAKWKTRPSWGASN